MTANNKQIYNSANWQRLRKRKLATTPICEVCEKAGVLTPATVVDHITAMTKGGHAFPQLSELMSMCVACHNSKTNVERSLRRGCDINGLPLDPRHEFHRRKA